MSLEGSYITITLVANTGVDDDDNDHFFTSIEYSDQLTLKGVIAILELTTKGLKREEEERTREEAR